MYIYIYIYTHEIYIYIYIYTHTYVPAERIVRGRAAAEHKGLRRGGPAPGFPGTTIYYIILKYIM